jgi:hypothetical protein
VRCASIALSVQRFGREERVVRKALGRSALLLAGLLVAIAGLTAVVAVGSHHSVVADSSSTYGWD